jgi:hypothetical protein
MSLSLASANGWLCQDQEQIGASYGTEVEGPIGNASGERVMLYETNGWRIKVTYVGGKSATEEFSKTSCSQFKMDEIDALLNLSGITNRSVVSESENNPRWIDGIKSKRASYEKTPDCFVLKTEVTAREREAMAALPGLTERNNEARKELKEAIWKFRYDNVTHQEQLRMLEEKKREIIADADAVYAEATSTNSPPPRVVKGKPIPKAK